MKGCGGKENWKWGAIHCINFPHVIGSKLSFFNRGPFPVPGVSFQIPFSKII